MQERGVSIMPLHIKAKDVPKRKHNPIKGDGMKEVSRIYGRECNISPNWYHPGYHTRPHYHDCEQINYVIEGEIWVFVADEGFHCKQGDYIRIPRGRIHWAWNNFDKTALVIEAHSPPLIAGKPGSTAVGLFDDDEDPNPPVIAENLYDKEFDHVEPERRALAKEKEEASAK
jgi:quercetin dioxygenase-like cupin family protein